MNQASRNRKNNHKKKARFLKTSQHQSIN